MSDAMSPGTRPPAARQVVEKAARMGLCSQTHHEHLMMEARAALEIIDQDRSARPVASGDAPLHTEEALGAAIHWDREHPIRGTGGQLACSDCRREARRHLRYLAALATPSVDGLRAARDKVIAAARELNWTMPDQGDGDPLSDLDDAIQELDEAERAALAAAPVSPPAPSREELLLSVRNEVVALKQPTLGLAGGVNRGEVLDIIQRHIEALAGLPAVRPADGWDEALDRLEGVPS